MAAEVQPQEKRIFGEPIKSLQSTLKDAAQRHGSPIVDSYRKFSTALVFGDYGDIIIAFSEGRNVYLFENNTYGGVFNVVEVLAVMREYNIVHGRMNDVRPIDTLAWYAEQYAPRPFKRADLRQYERRPRSWARWCAALVEAQRHSAADALYREHVAHVQDTRPMG